METWLRADSALGGLQCDPGTVLLPEKKNRTTGQQQAKGNFNQEHTKPS
jgi:hypothetical protein